MDNKTQDVIRRALKTAVQTFFGVLIPEVCALLNNGFPDDWGVAWAYLAPVVAAALSAAISTLWNLLTLEDSGLRMLEEQEDDETLRGETA